MKSVISLLSPFDGQWFASARRKSSASTTDGSDGLLREAKHLSPVRTESLAGSSPVGAYPRGSEKE
jgi:gentisate 1,2-dioxygenase